MTRPSTSPSRDVTCSVSPLMKKRGTSRSKTSSAARGPVASGRSVRIARMSAGSSRHVEGKERAVAAPRSDPSCRTPFRGLRSELEAPLNVFCCRRAARRTRPALARWLASRGDGHRPRLDRRAREGRQSRARETDLAPTREDCAHTTRALGRKLSLPAADTASRLGAVGLGVDPCERPLLRQGRGQRDLEDRLPRLCGVRRSARDGE